MNKKKTASLGMFTRIVGSQGFVSVLSVLIAFAIGAILIAATGASVTDAYYAMFRGAIVDPQASTFMRAIKPLTDSELACSCTERITHHSSFCRCIATSYRCLTVTSRRVPGASRGVTHTEPEHTR